MTLATGLIRLPTSDRTIMLATVALSGHWRHIENRLRTLSTCSAVTSILLPFNIPETLTRYRIIPDRRISLHIF